MKPLYILLGALLGGLAVLGLSQLGSTEATGVPGDGELLRADGPTSVGDQRIAELESQVENLTRQVDDLRFEISNLGEGERSALPATDLAETVPLNEERDPQWYLERYVASFRGGGDGTEYFRLAVQAYLPSLLTEVCKLVAKPSANLVMRRKLVEMLGDERFRESPMVTKVLLDQLSKAEDEALLMSVVQALETVGTDRTLPRLESAVWDISSKRAQHRCLRLITRLAGDQINESILALMRRATDDSARAVLINLISESDLAKALAVFEFTSRSELAVRLQAAKRVGRFHGEDFIAFVDEWIAYEPNEKVRQALGEAKRKQQQIPSWHPMQMAGPRNVPNVSQDSPAAWASMAPNGGTEWAELTYETPFRANLVRIHEVCTAGGVAEVYLVATSGKEHLVWSGTDPTTSPSVFEIGFSTTSYSVRSVRIVLDTSRVQGWNEIDAVELVGPGNRAWAKSAKASNYFGGPATR